MERQKGDRGLLNTKANLILALFCGRDKITAQITKTFPIIKKKIVLMQMLEAMYIHKEDEQFF